MKVIFSHGKESGPWGAKIRRLASVAEQLSCAVDSIDYTDLINPDQRVERLSALLQQESEPVILVGSSMGGYVSVVTALQCQAKIKGVFVLAPALYMPGYAVQECRFGDDNKFPIEIVHGWSDEVIPPENSYRFAQENRCSLHLLPGDHRLNDALPMIEPLFERFLKRLK
jgi:predicted esterase